MAAASIDGRAFWGPRSAAGDAVDFISDLHIIYKRTRTLLPHVNVSRRALLGTRRPRRRIAAATVGLLAGCTLAFLARLDVVIPLSGWELGFVVFSAGLVVAAYAGWARGGAFPGVGSVFLLLLWMAIFSPAVAYLGGESIQGAGTARSA